MLVVPRVTPDLAEIQHPRRVSVVITIFNQARYVRPCVESVIAQTHSDWEILLIDDGSNDGVTGQACAACLDIAGVQGKIRVKRIKNGGVSVARNVGMATSDPAAPYILFLDGDDLLLPNALSSLLATLEEAPEAVAAVGCCRRINDEGTILNPSEHERDHGGLLLNFPVVEADAGLFPPATLVIRKWAARACGGFDGAMRTVEDFDFYARLSLWGPIKGVSDFVCHYRMHPQNISKNGALMGEGFTITLAKHADYYRAWKRRTVNLTPNTNQTLHPSKQESLAPSLSKIPKIIHHIWLGNKEMPSEYRENINGWEQRHPNWEFKLWTDTDADALNLVNRRIYDARENKGWRSDVLRYEIMLQFGGVYVDTDIECLKNIEPLLAHSDVVIGSNPPENGVEAQSIENAFLAAEPGHPFFQEVVDRLAINFDRFLAEKRPFDWWDVLRITGPIYLAESIRHYRQQPKNYRRDITVAPQRFVYPANYWQVQENRLTEVDLSDAYMLHRWDGSWCHSV